MYYSHTDNYVKSYKGNQISNTFQHDIKKVIVLDIDETLGAFNELDVLWKCMAPIVLAEKDNPLAIHSRFNELLDLYPEFLRYGILQIFQYLYQKKQSGHCYKIYIYTNNQCENNWVSLILNYFTYKTRFIYHAQYYSAAIQNIDLFDQVIYAFKINNKQIEIKRTTHSKTYRDFIQCTMLPHSTEVCFVDNAYFPEMKNEKVYYIQPLSYLHCLSIDEICGRLFCAPLWIVALKHCITEKRIRESFYYYREPKLNKIEHFHVNMAVAQKIMFHIKEFFLFNTFRNKTRKRKQRTMFRTTKKSKCPFPFVL